MVEKWLLQVEEGMIASVRDVIKQSVEAYTNTSRDKWVLDWPGQVILCGSQIYWTSEVVESMKEEGGIQV